MQPPSRQIWRLVTNLGFRELSDRDSTAWNRNENICSKFLLKCIISKSSGQGWRRSPGWTKWANQLVNGWFLTDPCRIVSRNIVKPGLQTEDNKFWPSQQHLRTHRCKQYLKLTSTVKVLFFLQIGYQIRFLSAPYEEKEGSLGCREGRLRRSILLTT